MAADGREEGEVVRPLSWDKWPYTPRTLTEAMDPDPDQAAELMRLLVSGSTERLQRAMTVLEPGDPVRRVDHVNPYDHFTAFCRDLRKIGAFDAICVGCDTRHMDEGRLQHAAPPPGGVAGGPVAATEPARAPGTQEDGAPQLRVSRYPCDHGLIDYSCPVVVNGRLAAVSLSGQFLPQRDDETVGKIVSLATTVVGVSEALTERQIRMLVETVPTEEEYVRDHRRWCELNQVHYPVEGEHPPHEEAMLLFQHEIEQLEGIAQRQYDLQKHRKEADLLESVVEPLVRPLPEATTPAAGTSPRDLVRPRVIEALQRLCKACALKWAIVFVSPRQLLSVPAATTLLEPFGWYGLADGDVADVLHFNWRKAQAARAARGKDLQPEKQPWAAGPRGPFQRGLRGARREVLEQASHFAPLSVSHAYRAICVLGPLSDGEETDLDREAPFLEEVTRMVMLHTLSRMEGLDFDEDTRKWTEVGAMLVHLSRRSIQPVRAAEDVLRDHFEGREGYTKDRAKAALSALEKAMEIVEGEAAEPFEVLVAPVEDRYVWEECVVAGLVEAVVAIFRPLAQEEKQCEIVITSEMGHLPRLECDRKKVAIALGHLLDNAIKYGHAKKEIRVGAHQDGDAIEIWVDDFGQGIPEDDLGRIWDFGFQGERSKRARGEEGDGIGLFHVRTIAGIHRGEASVRVSERRKMDWSQKLEGYRVKFTLRLPIRRPEER